MIVLVTLTVGLVIWVVGWAFGFKSFDVFMLTTLMVVSAAGLRIALPFVNQRLGRTGEPADQRGPPTAPGSVPS
ncbi:MAG: hypothetical protein M3433_04785 [Actinomycetota bacterium]|nr:hypothetical protein [Actinomycetota bacterium]